MNPRSESRGFSLLEMMAVIAILMVLATVAMVSYKGYMRKARVQEGIAFLMDIKMKQETYFMTYSRFVDTGTNPDDMYPALPFAPQPWATAGAPWDCASPPNNPVQAFCDLGIRPSSESTFFQYVTMGWEPGDPLPPASPDGPYVSDATRRWWFARARGYMGSDGNTLPFELRLSSEVAEIIQIGP
jgi:prepilin-type N-terminal cleavage/methylation domain-containing protein